MVLPEHAYAFIPPPSPHRVHLLPEIAFLSLPLSPRDLVWLKRTNHTREKSRNPKERNNKKVSQFPEIQSVLIIKHSLKKINWILSAFFLVNHSRISSSFPSLRTDWMKGDFAEKKCVCVFGKGNKWKIAQGHSKVKDRASERQEERREIPNLSQSQNTPSFNRVSKRHINSEWRKTQTKHILVIK